MKLLAVICILSFSSPCWGDSIAITPEEPYYLHEVSNQTRGWAFTVESDNIVVTKLGIFDAGADGLEDSHSVSIWAGTGDLVMTTTIPDGLAGELSGMFRYVDVPPTMLKQNEWYVIGGYYGIDSSDVWSDTDDADTDPAIFYRLDQWADGEAFPNQLGRAVDPGYFGPNFQFVVVPEPNQWMLFALGFVPLLSRCRTYRLSLPSDE